MPLVSGDRLGTYEIIGPLGTGGMGEVYRARDTTGVGRLPRWHALLKEVGCRAGDKLTRPRVKLRMIGRRTFEHSGHVLIQRRVLHHT